MLNIGIIILILLVLTVHRYCFIFWQQGQVPYPMGFSLFADSFVLIYLVSFIWMFGIIGGIVVALLCFLQVVYSACLWVFLLPAVINMHKSFDNSTIPKVNFWVYGGFSYLVITTAILTVINFSVSPYKSIWKLMGDNVWTAALIFIGILVVGNISRVAVMSKFIRR